MFIKNYFESIKLQSNIKTQCGKTTYFSYNKKSVTLSHARRFFTLPLET